MTATLLDGNALIALTVADHVHHRCCREWFAGYDGRLATCAITQGTLLRFLLREAIGARRALTVLQQVESLPRHVFWADEINYDASVLAGVIGHRQVTDAYLAALAGHFGGSLATLDQGLAMMRPETAELIPT